MSGIESPEEIHFRLKRGVAIILFLAFPLMIGGGLIPVGVWMVAMVPLRYKLFGSRKTKILLYLGLYILAVIVAIGVEGTSYEIHILSGR